MPIDAEEVMVWELLPSLVKELAMFRSELVAPSRVVSTRRFSTLPPPGAATVDTGLAKYRESSSGRVIVLVVRAWKSRRPAELNPLIVLV